MARVVEVSYPESIGWYNTYRLMETLRDFMNCIYGAWAEDQDLPSAKIEYNAALWSGRVYQDVWQRGANINVFGLGLPSMHVYITPVIVEGSLRGWDGKVMMIGGGKRTTFYRYKNFGNELTTSIEAGRRFAAKIVKQAALLQSAQTS